MTLVNLQLSPSRIYLLFVRVCAFGVWLCVNVNSEKFMFMCKKGELHMSFSEDTMEPILADNSHVRPHLTV
jgi:hypothetical protein